MFFPLPDTAVTQQARFFMQANGAVVGGHTFFITYRIIYVGI